MITIQQRILGKALFGFLIIILLASLAPSAHADVLFIGEPEEAAVEGDEFTDEAAMKKKSNPVAVLSGAVNKKLKGVTNSVDVALRGSLNTTSASREQWPVILAALLFLMLLMKLRRRSKKNRFS
jgi:hypothetical protein